MYRPGVFYWTIAVFSESRAGRCRCLCKQADEGAEQGCKEFIIRKGRFFFRLTAPCSDERRRAVGEAAKAVANDLTKSMI